MSKKILCVLLMICFAAGTVNPAMAATQADGGNFVTPKTSAPSDSNVSYTKNDLSMVQVLADNGLIHLESALNAGGTWYFSTDFFSEYTNYEYESDKSRFVMDGEAGKPLPASPDKIFRKIIAVDPNNKTIRVKGNPEILEDIITLDGKTYLPGYQVFPYLDTICSVVDNTIVFSRPESSFAQLLKDFRISDYYFDADKEFGSGLIKDLEHGAALFWDTVTHFDLARVINSPAGNPADIRGVFTGYLTDQDGINYYSSSDRAQAKENSMFIKTCKRTNKLFSKLATKPYLKNVIELFEAAGKNSKALQKASEWVTKKIPKQVLDGFDDFYDSYKSVYSEAKTGLKYLGYVDKMFMSGWEYYMNSMSVVDDNREAMLAVYPDLLNVTSSTSVWETEASLVYDMYEEQDFDGLTKKFGTDLFELWYSDFLLDKSSEGIFGMLTGQELAPYKFGLALVGAGFDLFHEYMYYVNDFDVGFGAIDDLAVIDLHLRAQEEAKNACEGYLKKINVDGEYTQENLENFRLSAILALLSAKKMYAIIRDNASDFFAETKMVKSSCDYRIENISKKLADLYEAGANVTADGVEFFQAAELNALDQFANLTGEKDAVLANYWSAISRDGIDITQTKYMFLEDITGDDIPELFVSDYKPSSPTFSAYSFNGKEVKLIDSTKKDKTSDKTTCIYLTEDKQGRTGLFTLEFTLDETEYAKAVQKFSKNAAKGINTALKQLFDDFFNSALAGIDWEFNVYDREGINDIPDYGGWTPGDDKQAVMDKISEYAGTEYLLYRCGNEELMDKLAKSSINHMSKGDIEGSFWFGAFLEKYPDGKVPESELAYSSASGGTPQAAASDVSAAAQVFEMSTFVWTIMDYAESSYLVKDADKDGTNELLLNYFDYDDGYTVAVAMDINNSSIIGKISGSAAGSISYAEHTTDGLTLLKEYYYTAMNGSCVYYEWTGTGWEVKARMEQTVKEDQSGEWVTEGSGNWWGEDVTVDGFRGKEDAEIADVLNGWTPDLSCVQIQGNASDLSEELYLYLIKGGRNAFVEDGLKELSVAYTTGDLDMDGTNEEIYVVIRPADPWLKMLNQSQGMSDYIPEEDCCSFIIVLDTIDRGTLQMTTSYHWDDFDGEIWDSDLVIKDGVLYIKDSASFVYNGTYVADMSLVG